MSSRRHGGQIYGDQVPVVGASSIYANHTRDAGMVGVPKVCIESLPAAVFGRMRKDGTTSGPVGGFLDHVNLLTLAQTNIYIRETLTRDIDDTSPMIKATDAYRLQSDAQLSWWLESGWTPPRDALVQVAQLKDVSTDAMLETLKHLWDLNDKGFIVVEFNERVCTGEAQGGHLSVLKWIRSIGFCAHTCVVGWGCGHTDVLQYPSSIGCPWNESTCTAAASGGHLDVLQWANLIGCLWDEQTCTATASDGYLDVLQWAHSNGCPWNESTCIAAASGGYLDVLQWAHSNGCPWDEQTCTKAADGGHLGVLKWLRNNDCPRNEETCMAAANGGHLHVLKWLRKNKCPWDELTCEEAARGGHLKTLQWAWANKCPWDKQTCSSAAIKGHLDVLQWAHEHDCPWNAETCSFAAINGDLNLLVWAHWSTSRCPLLAAVAHVLSSHGHPFSSSRSHCSTQSCPPLAAAAVVSQSHGVSTISREHGPPSFQAHCITARCPFSAMMSTSPFQLHPLSQAHWATSKYP